MIQGPAVVSVSGGRSSGMMLRMLLDEHGGTLPADVVPVFANTGEEAEGTLAFVREMAERWNVSVRWVEFTRAALSGVPADLAHWREVTFCDASRAGEPFDELIDWKKYLPNPTQRLCSEWLKVRAMLGFAASLGFPVKQVREDKKVTTVADFALYLGIRADEPARVAKQRAKALIELPLVDGGITRGGVANFWQAQPFDLHIRPGEGNCRMCFEKGFHQLRSVARAAPDEAGLDRWVAREARVGATMKKAHPYRLVQEFVRRQLPMFEEPSEEDHDMRPCACGD